MNMEERVQKQMESIAKAYEAKLAMLSEKVFNSDMHMELQIKSVSNKRLDEVIQKMTKITGKKVWDNLYYRTGKIFGILKTIADNAKLRDELYLVTGLTKDHLDAYYQYCGNVPWINKETGILDPGREQDIPKCKELIMCVALHFGVVLEDSDLSDITPERWIVIKTNALTKIQKSLENNETVENTIPENGYDE